MAASGYSKILIYGSSTPTAVPNVANLTTSANGVELAVNYADEKLYFKNANGEVKLLASSGMADNTAVSITGGTINGVVIGNTNTESGSFTTVSVDGGLSLSASPVAIEGNVGTPGQVMYSAGPSLSPYWGNPPGSGSNTASVSTAYTVDSSNPTQILTLVGNCTYAFPPPLSGKSFILIQKQDAVGGRLVTWPSSVRWPLSSAPTLTSTPSKTDVFSFVSDGTYWYGRSLGMAY